MMISLQGHSKYIALSEWNAIQLKIKFNLTDKGHAWSHIADALYYGKDIVVDDTQFYFLYELSTGNNILCEVSL